MSTRATYEFQATKRIYRDGQNWHDAPDITLYVHHDGYLAGAAAKLDFDGAICTTAESFIRHNAKAEITDSHDSHGDTDFRYTVYWDDRGSRAQILAEKRYYANTEDNESGKDYWKPVFDGALISFIIAYKPTS